jgi:DNA repair exonuclease SbcCD nuclease subunit
VGDVHAVEPELADCCSLLGFVLQTAIQTRPDYIVFLGDQHHNHNVLHVEVMGFWKKAFASLRYAGFPVIALVGNHDMTGVSNSTNHAMQAYTGDIQVIDRPTVIDGLLLMPFYQDPAQFVVACREFSSVKRVICHQTFTGTVYDGGFYAKDGIDPNLIPQEFILSGHIHSPQKFGKVEYIGSPRWRILTDANRERGIWLNTYKAGILTDRQVYSTGDVCQRLWHLVDSEETPVILQTNSKDRWRIDVKGAPEYVQKRLGELQGPGVRLHPVPTTQSNHLRVRESEGIGESFQKFVSGYVPKYGTSTAILEEMIRGRL